MNYKIRGCLLLAILMLTTSLFISWNCVPFVFRGNNNDEWEIANYKITFIEEADITTLNADIRKEILEDNSFIIDERDSWARILFLISSVLLSCTIIALFKDISAGGLFVSRAIFYGIPLLAPQLLSVYLNKSCPVYLMAIFWLISSSISILFLVERLHIKISQAIINSTIALLLELTSLFILCKVIFLPAS